MVDCEECGKKLGILKGYHHPVLGNRVLICGNCYTTVEGDMVEWSKFCRSDSFNKESSKSDIQEAWNKHLLNNPPLQKWFNNLWMKLG